MQVGSRHISKNSEYIYLFNLNTFFFTSSICSFGTLMEGHPCLVIIAIVSRNSGKKSKGNKRMHSCLENSAK